MPSLSLCNGIAPQTTHLFIFDVLQIVVRLSVKDIVLTPLAQAADLEFSTAQLVAQTADINLSVAKRTAR